MLFSSITFLVFFLPCVLLAYYMFPQLSYRNGILLIASLLFYAWGEPTFIILMIASIIFNYNVALWETKHTAHRALILFLGIAVNIGILFVFKYLGFTCKILNMVCERLHLVPLRTPNLIMPIGISFYTFQELSYLVDVYKNPHLVQTNPFRLGLYISLFPQLIAGPIIQYPDVYMQIEGRTHSFSCFSAGLERFVIGLCKKVLLANNMALVCDTIYDADFFSYGCAYAWIACFAYTLQIYYDFSGYSDMALGLAGMFGFNLPENFNYPYIASSITDFWRRWHISLTTFFRTYVYIPLGGNRRGNARTIRNRYITFLLTGLWHGAAFNFILWGLGHGTLMVIERLLIKRKQNGIRRVFGHCYTMLSVAFLWVIFRLGTKPALYTILKMIGINYTRFSASFRPFTQNVAVQSCITMKFYILAALCVICAFPWTRYLSMPQRTGRTVRIMFLSAKYAVLLFLFVLCYANLAANTYNPFIYFRF